MSGNAVDTAQDPQAGVPKKNQDWIDRIVAAKNWRDKHKSVGGWDRFEKYYNNDHIEQSIVLPSFNLTYMFGRSLMPSIIYQSPQVINQARRPEFIPWASAMDSLDNWLIIEMELEDIMRNAVLFGYLFNIGAVMPCFDFIGREPVGGNVIREMIKDLTGFAKLTGVTNRARRHNFPWLDLVDPKKLYFAPHTRNIRTCPWFVKAACYPTALLRKYYGDNSIQSTHIPQGFEYLEEVKKQQEDPDVEYTAIYEIHDARSGEWQVLDANGKTIVPCEEDKLQVDGLPLEAVIFNQAPFSIWGTPDPAYIEGQHLDGDDARVQLWKQRRVSLLKGLVDEGAISKAELEKFYTDDALPFIRVKPNGTKNLQESVALLQPHTHQELYPHNEKLIEDAQRILGFGPNQLGTFAPGRRTMKEVQIVEDRNQARSSERRETVAQVIANVMRKVNLQVVRNWKKPIIQRVIGMDLAAHWVEITPGEFQEDHMRDEIRTTVDVASMTPISNERLKQEMMEVLDLVIKIPGANALPVVKKLLGKFPWVNVEEVLPQANAAPVPMEQFAAQQRGMMNNPGQMAEAQKRNVQALPALLQGNKGPRRK